MLYSAVSLAIAITAQQTQPVTAVPPVWTTVQPSVIELVDPRGVNGVAALIHDSGLFLAHNSSVSGTVVRGRFSDRSEVSLVVVAVDEQTQLALLKAMVWASGVRKPINVAPEPTKDGVELLAVTVGGPKIGEFIGGNKAGVMKPSLRYVPLSEIRMRSSNEHLGGSFVFNLKGELVGVLGAALADENSKAADTGTRVAAGAGGGGFGGASSLRQFGESSVTVAYALGREVLQRVVKGFVSPSHEVEHPTIGIFFKASTDGRGVLVDSVMASSPAGQAGIQPGDVILEVDGIAVNNPVDLAVMLFRKDVGDKVTVRYLRGLVRGTANMTVASTQVFELGR
jgi:S1-C subfamily serine protease